MNDPRRGQPDRDKDRDELGQSGTQTTNRVLSPPSQPDAGASLQNIEILEDVWDCHQPEGSQEPQTNPRPVQVYGDKWGGNGEVVNEGVELQHEPELVRGGDELK